MKPNSRFCRVVLTASASVVISLAYAPQRAAQTNTFPASGNVGVGTTSPSYGLQVEKTNGSGGNGWTAFFREAGKNGAC